jgi:hypothetical protein
MKQFEKKRDLVIMTKHGIKCRQDPQKILKSLISIITINEKYSERAFKAQVKYLLK